MSRRRIGIGIFEVKSGHVVVSDPCYPEVGKQSDKGTDYQLNDEISVKNGLWVATVIIDAGRVMRLEAMHIDHLSYSPIMTGKPTLTEYELCDGVDGFGVDSGQMCFCDSEAYPSHKVRQVSDDWYEGLGKLTLRRPIYAGVFDGGCVSMTGWGDGSYPLYTMGKDDETFGLSMPFDQEEDEEYEDDVRKYS